MSVWGDHAVDIDQDSLAELLRILPLLELRGLAKTEARTWGSSTMRARS